MKFSLTAALAFVSISSAAADDCVIAGNNAAWSVAMDYGCLPPTESPVVSPCYNCPNWRTEAVDACASMADFYLRKCGENVREKILKNKCRNELESMMCFSVSEGEDESFTIENVVVEDEMTTLSSSLSSSSDAPSTSVFLRGGLGNYCGKWKTSSGSTQRAVIIVEDLYKRKGKKCSYALGKFRKHAKRALRKEFPSNCRDAASFDANKNGRRAGEMKIDNIVKECKSSGGDDCSQNDIKAGRRIVRSLKLSCSTAKYGDIEVERELAKRRGINNCITKAAKDYLKEIQDNCRNINTNGKSEFAGELETK